jgi:hypothetical protein
VSQDGGILAETLVLVNLHGITLGVLMHVRELQNIALLFCDSVKGTL